MNDGFCVARLAGPVLALATAALAGAQTPAAPAPPSGQPPAAEAPEAFLKRFDVRQKNVRDFSAAFTQTFRSGALQRELVESGSLRVLRPGRMSFDYEKPEKKRFVADGSSYYFYVPADRQVVVQTQQGDRRAAARVLAGGALLDAFRIEREEHDPQGRRFTLTPIEADPDTPRIAVVVDAALRLVVLEIEDATGARSRLAFRSIRENTGLREKDFRFAIPKGVEVIS